MVITRLSGGMGNQMFQYAVGRSLAIKNNTTLGLDTTFLLDRTPIPHFTFRDYNLDGFNIDAVIVSKNDVPWIYRKYNIGWVMRYVDYIRRKILPLKGKEKKPYSFDQSILNLGPDTYLEGWWQNPNYFSEYADTIRKDFTLNNPSEKAVQLIQEIKSKHAVCVQIRRGDYIRGDTLGRSYHPVLDVSYYQEALSLISKTQTIDCIYVFDRDDIEWCKENMQFDYPTIYVENDITLPECVIAMSSCKHFILANSSLSWWAAWLSDNPHKQIIAPKKWLENDTIDTTDLIPEGWVRL